MAFLLAINGLDSGRIYPLSAGQHVLGRGPECSVVIELSSVSRRHAELVVAPDSTSIRDLGSRNGTLVNNQRLRDGSHPLAEGDLIRLSDVAFRFHHDSPHALEESGGGQGRGGRAGGGRERDPSSTQLIDRARFAPTASGEAIRLRGRLLARIRQFFDEQGFLEVETPLLSYDTVVEPHIEPIRVELGGRVAWLQSSPEFGMKRLLASGLDAIYQVARAFRAEESGDRHNPEFTIVEWYRTGDTMDEAMERLGNLAARLLDRPSPERLSYREAFLRHVGFDPLTAPDSVLLQVIAGLDFQPPDDWRSMDRDDWLNMLLAERIEPHLGQERPTILHDYPPSQAALAQVRPGPPAVAERFELYVDGVELANGYHELLDAGELRVRARQANVKRERAGRRTLPEDNRLLAAMEHGLPDCCGVALGFDRLLMVAGGYTRIDQVLAFPGELA